MIDRENVFDIERHNAEAQATMQTIHANGRHKSSLILDVDETLVNTVLKQAGQWALMAEHHAQKYFGLEDMIGATIEEVLAAGGTEQAYIQILVGHGYTPTHSKAKVRELAEKVRAHFTTNRGAPQMYSNQKTGRDVSTVVKDLSKLVNLPGYISARPGTERVLDTTRADLARLHLPNSLPIILRPGGVDIDHTADWKLELLKEIAASTPDPNKVVVIFDDSLSTARAIQEYNIIRALETGLPPNVIQLLFTKGPLTERKVEAGHFPEDKVNGIYYAKWENLEEVVRSIF